jgi:hypothetical protein
MIRPRRDTQIPLRYREKSLPRFSKTNNHLKRRKIDSKSVDRNDVDLALAVIAPAPECSDEPPTLIPTELPHFNANYVQNRHEESHHINLSEIGFFKLFFSDLVVKILSEEINSYAESQLRNPPLSSYKTRHWVPTTPAEILVFLGVYLHFGLHPTTVREDY